MMRRGSRLALLVLIGAVLAAGCAADAGKKPEEETEVPRPEWRVGDRWAFNRTSLAGVSTVVTRQVVAATAEGYTLRVLGVASEATRLWTRDFHLAQETFGGGATARYEPPAAFFTWPLKPATTWSQEFQYTDGRNDGRYANTWKVGETIEPIDTVAGRFYTLRVERSSGPQRLETYWYSPRIRFWVRLEDSLRGYVEELVEYKSWSGS
jgi:hypothetical protein